MSAQVYFMSKVTVNRAHKGKGEESWGIVTTAVQTTVSWESRSVWANLSVHHLSKEETRASARDRVYWTSMNLVPQRLGGPVSPSVCSSGGNWWWGYSQAALWHEECKGRREGSGVAEQAAFSFQLDNHRWSGPGLLQCWRHLCISKRRWSVFCMGNDILCL